MAHAAGRGTDAALDRLRARAEQLRDSPTAARSAARVALDQARVAGDPLAVTLAAQALGTACRERGDIGGAAEALFEAVDAADSSGVARERGLARLRLAGLHLVNGELRAARLVAREARAHLQGADMARLSVLLAVVEERSGRLSAALAAYDRAEAELADAPSLARLRLNRAVVLGQLGRIADAERETAAAAADLVGEGSAGLVLPILNLAWLSGLSGDVPRSLQRYDEALAQADLTGFPLGMILRDRAELLAAVGLWDDAITASMAAVGDLAVTSPADAPEAQLILARALVGAGRADQAAAEAARAATRFAEQDRPTWAARAQLDAINARRAGGELTLDDPARAADLAADLAEAGFVAEAADGRALAVRVAAALGVAPPRSAWPLDHRAGPPWVRARSWLADAEHLRAAGERSAAGRAAARGLDEATRLRGAVGSAELRAGVAATAADLGDLLVECVTAAPGARALLAAAERRAGGVLPAPTGGPELAAALAGLRAAAARQVGAEGEGAEPEAAALRALAGAEAEVRRVAHRSAGRTAGHVGSAARTSATVGELVDGLGDDVLLRFVAASDRLWLVVLAGRRARRLEIGPLAPVADRIDQVRFALRRMAAGGPAGERAERALAAASDDLERLLLGGARRVMGDRPMVVVPDGPLHALPWAALTAVAARPCTLAPSATAWLAARQQSSPKRRSVQVLVAGPELDGAAPEVEALSGLWGKSARPFTGAAATVAAVTEALAGAAVAHFACHGRFRADSPLFSRLELADGPLLVHDLIDLPAAPSLVVLAACEVGESMGVAGAEVLGVTAALLAAGTRTVVASAVPLPDGASTAVLAAMTKRLVAGDEPRAALHAAATQAATSTDLTSRAVGLALSCHGAG